MELCAASGKSFTSLKILEKINKKTLIIVDQILILEQWIEYITEWSNYRKEDISIIQGTNLSFDKNIIIATVQTLEKNLELCDKFKKDISFIIVDECHCAAADTFQTILYHFKPHYLLGLSATMNRDDDLTFLITHSIGDVYFVADRGKMVEQGLIMKPELRPILMKRKSFYLFEESKKIRNANLLYRKVLNAFKQDKTIVKFVCELAYYHQKKGDKILMIIKEEQYARQFYEFLLKKMVFTKEQIDEFQKIADTMNDSKKKKVKEKSISMFEKNFFDETKEIKKKYKIPTVPSEKFLNEQEVKNMRKKLENHIEEELDNMSEVQWYDVPQVEENSRIAIIMGKTKPERRKIIIEKTKNKEIDIVITTKIFDKGISANCINVLFNLFPNREVANNIQRVGFLIKKGLQILNKMLKYLR